MVKEVMVHKITVALIVIGCYGIVFVKIVRGYSRKIKLALFVLFDKASVKSLGGRAGGKTEYPVGILLYVIGKYLRRHA